MDPVKLGTSAVAVGGKQQDERTAASAQTAPGRVVADVVASAGLGGSFFDDQAAITVGPRRDGYNRAGASETPEATSVMLAFEDGDVAIGDSATLLSGVGGASPD